MLAKVARGSHGSSPSDYDSNHSDGASHISATVAYDEPGFSIPLSYSILSKEIRDKTSELQKQIKPGICFGSCMAYHST